MQKYSNNKKNIETLFYPTMCGISRASLFLAIALNGKNKINIESWDIVDGASLFSLPVKSESFLEIFDEFKSFVVKNSLREMIELFEKTMVKIFSFFHSIDNDKETAGLSMGTAVKNFSRKSFPEKLKQVALLINSQKLDLAFLQAIQDIRNIITHNMSIVDKENLILVLPVFNSIIKNIDTGEEVQVPLGRHIKAPNGSLEFSFSITMQNKIFKKGEIVSFSSEEIYYLLFAMIISVDVLKKEVVNSLESRKKIWTQSL
ncbi:hypothetical protein AAIR98_001377 [Elusimicrobium simillimum]|uniref:hypothetical protein n=1 Tax=Elusimicrobium simillimum TaxID=3143438 RepID=UPI003C6F8F0D